MLYAKCIRSSQRVNNINEFEKLTRLYHNDRENNHNVYMLGQTTYDTTLNCVPLNYIFCAMKYGDICAILETPETVKSLPYEKPSNLVKATISLESQTPVEFLNMYNLEDVKRIIELIGNPSLIADNLYYSSCYKDKHPDIYNYYVETVLNKNPYN